MSTKSAVLTTCAVGAILIAGCGGGGATGNISPTINDTPPIVWTWTGAETIDLTAYASDIETPSVDLVYSVVTQPSGGTVGVVDAEDVFTTPTAVVYTVVSGGNGVEYFTFMVSDGVSSDTATVWIGVNNTAPDGPDTGPLAVTEDGSLVIDLNALGVTDAEGDPVLFVLDIGPANGTLTAFPTSLEDPVTTTAFVTYTPNPDFPAVPAGVGDPGDPGTDFFTFTVTDMVGTSAVIRVDIEVNAVNDDPVADVVHEVVAAGGSVDIQLSGSDPDNDTLTYYVTSLPDEGTLYDDAYAIQLSDMPSYLVTGQLSFSAPDGWGTHSFTYVANDGTADSAPGSVNIGPTLQSCWGWGRNDLGQLGHGGYQDKVEYAKQLPEPRDYVMVDGGFDHSVYMSYSQTDATYFIDRASGSNEWGQLGMPSTRTKWPIPSSIPSTAQTQHAAAGYKHTLVVALRESPADDTDYGVWGCGENSGRLGNGENPHAYTPVEMLFALPYSNDDQNAATPNVTLVEPRFKMVAGGAVHSLALDTDGDVWAVGTGTDDQLGLGGTWARRYAVKITGDLDTAVIVDIAAGGNASLALDSGGSVWAWGTGAGFWSPAPYNMTAAGYVPTCQSISAGEEHWLFVSTTGVIWTVGANEHGQLGDNGSRDIGVPPASVSVSDDDSNPVTGFIQVAAGGRHSLALTNDGRVFACGNNTQGQCGTGFGTGLAVPVFTQVRRNATLDGYLRDIVYIGAGGEHSLAVDTE